MVLPLVPDRPIGPHGSLNPHSIWILVILIMTIGAAGYIAVRSVGARFGLPIAGLASGFISSTATIGAMGALAARTKALLPAAVAGAVLSTVATIVEMTIVLAATSGPTVRTLSIPLVCAGVAAVVYGTTFTIWAMQQKTEDQQPGGRAFSLRTALAFAVTLAGILIASATLSIPSMILAETALSFLGLGLRPPITSWGVLLNEATDINVVAVNWWLLFPVVPVVLVILAYQFMGDGMRDAADPYA